MAADLFGGNDDQAGTVQAQDARTQGAQEQGPRHPSGQVLHGVFKGKAAARWLSVVGPQLYDAYGLPRVWWPRGLKIGRDEVDQVTGAWMLKNTATPGPLLLVQLVVRTGPGHAARAVALAPLHRFAAAWPAAVVEVDQLARMLRELCAAHPPSVAVSSELDKEESRPSP